MNFLIVLLVGSDSTQCPLVVAELWTVRRRPPFGRIYVPKTITFDKICFLNSSVIFSPTRGLLFYLIRLNFLFAVLTAYRFTRNGTKSSDKWETFQLNGANFIHGRLRWYAPYTRNPFALFATFSLCFQCLLYFLATFYRQLYSGNTQWRDSCGRYEIRQALRFADYSLPNCKRFNCDSLDKKVLIIWFDLVPSACYVHMYTTVQSSWTHVYLWSDVL